MSIIDILRPYVSLCQACGFIPYVMERDSKTKRFVKFNFSWRNSITWWFIALACSQLAFSSIVNKISANMTGKSNGKEETPVTVRILMVVMFFCYVIQLIIARRIVLLQHVRLQNIVKLALRVEVLLQTTNNHPSHQISSFIHRRFVIGFCLLAISVIKSLFSQLIVLNINKWTCCTHWQSISVTIGQSMMMKSFIANMNSIEIVCLFSTHTIMSFMVGSPILLMDLILFTIAKFIKFFKFDGIETAVYNNLG